MSRALAVLLGLLSVLLAFPVTGGGAASQPPPVTSDQEPTFRSTASELVVLPVVVTDRPDRHVRYVSDLTHDQFVIYDNGRRVPLDFFSSEDTPVTLGLIIDSSSSMREKLGEVIVAALAFVKSSNPNDEVFALSFSDDVREPMPHQRFLAASDLEGLNHALTSLVAQGRTSLYDALLEGLDRLASGTQPRKVLLLISDGGDNASRATLDRVLARARASNAAIYTIGMFDDTDLDRNPRVLKTIASATGGERYLPRSAGPLLSACQHIAREIRSGYTIGYVPPDRDGTFHRVRVDVTTADKRKLTVRTRPGYFASRQTSE
jgi:Ca-activated chloride channel family protein